MHAHIRALLGTAAFLREPDGLRGFAGLHLPSRVDEFGKYHSPNICYDNNETAEARAAREAAEEAARSRGRNSERFSPEYVHELREENKAWRLKAQGAETAQQQAAREKAEAETRATNAEKTAKEREEAAAKAADDRAKVRETEADAKAQQRIIRSELKAEALKAGLIDADGLQFVDFTKLKLNEKDELVGGEEAIKLLKAAKPYLFKAATGTSNRNERPAPSGDAPKTVRGLSDAEYKAERARVTGNRNTRR